MASRRLPFILAMEIGSAGWQANGSVGDPQAYPRDEHCQSAHGDRCAEFLRHGVLLVLSAPRQLLVLAGPEHGSMAVWRERMHAAKAVDMVDNADALTTCPQQQQQTEALAA